MDRIGRLLFFITSERIQVFYSRSNCKEWFPITFSGMTYYKIVSAGLKCTLDEIIPKINVFFNEDVIASNDIIIITSNSDVSMYKNIIERQLNIKAIMSLQFLLDLKVNFQTLDENIVYCWLKEDYFAFESNNLRPVSITDLSELRVIDISPDILLDITPVRNQSISCNDNDSDNYIFNDDKEKFERFLKKSRR